MVHVYIVACVCVVLSSLLLSVRSTIRRLAGEGG